MESFFWTLAAALVVGLAALALKRPYLYVQLATIGFHLGALLAFFGMGRFSVGGSYGMTLTLAGAGVMAYLYVLGHLAAAGLNTAKKDQARQNEAGDE